MTKDLVLECLQKKTDEYVSGAEIAAELSLSRTAVWKAIEQLRADGYRIESVTNRGYRLSSESDVLSEAGIRKYLHSELKLKVYPTVTSTNTLLKAEAEQGAAEGTVIVAAEQTAGRGRMGRSFYSPAGTGIYMSILLRPQIPAADAGLITAGAAAAVADAVDALSESSTQIKWVNDVYLNGRKISGILTEGSIDCETGFLSYAIVGIGINITPPEGDFPEDIRAVAGAAFGEDAPTDLRCRLTAEVLERFLAYYADLQNVPFYDAYRRRSVVIGRQVRLIAPGREPEEAEVLDIDRNFALVVRDAYGQLRTVSSGEVSLRPLEGSF